ncbi:hypothetical protein B005_2744 [Nocardiopsis alba ATCC BAA-2165]|uniref:Uncharacterized protein n=1 Tax=Nocardiopsis alba (strain ATCC BAA-2165 / BE74) TaxID=1205910 RepID=J7L8K4_NOCAA|nr:hypothetical protein B005_2744 [Nocardiopsis alba ATCC BAA-2165]
MTHTLEPGSVNRRHPADLRLRDPLATENGNVVLSSLSATVLSCEERRH